MEQSLFALLLGFPLIGFLINGFNFRKENCKLAGLIGTTAVALSFVVGSFLFIKILNAESHVLNVNFFNWISVGPLRSDFAFTMDPISGVMTLIITGVGSLIHLFSIGYMAHDSRPFKYFSYLNLFIFNMLVLVLGSNLLITFIGWEGVGLCSYLLIGFWFTDEQKSAAGMKAFITNRIGDAGLLLGIFLIFAIFQSLNYDQITQYSTSMAVENSWSGAITLSVLFLFLGVVGKSAQIPLYVWLPDAMAGPTPVSALIHAATMVTAGVYLLIRLSSLLVLAPNAMLVIACVGALTALLAATIGMTQWDIKKILAYSTVSQLGYMIMAVGVGAFIPAFFHLITHAFFKALMFLGSGSIIHSMDEEQDVRKMGGLGKYLPITHLTFIVGWLAIIGFPPFSGFFSKDEILWVSFASEKGSWIFWFIGFIAAGCTAFYMTRLMCLTFWGQARFDASKQPHESPWTMSLPLVVLAFLAAFAGLLGLPHLISNILPGHPTHILEDLMTGFVAPTKLHHFHIAIEWLLLSLSILIAVSFSILAYFIYIKKKIPIEKILESTRPVYDWVYNKYYVDEFYFNKIIHPIRVASKSLWQFVDVMFIDRITYWASESVQEGGKCNQVLQSGRFQTYALMICLGLVGWFIVIFML